MELPTEIFALGSECCRAIGNAISGNARPAAALDDLPTIIAHVLNWGRRLIQDLLLDRANWVLLNVAKFFPLPQVRRFLDRLWVIPISAVSMVAAQMMIHETIVRNLWVWIVEFLKLAGRRRLYPVNAECPICRQMVRLHYKKAGRRHVLAHARACSRALYEGSRYAAHYTAKLKCLGSGMLAKFDPRPNEHQHFNTPKSL